MSLMINRNRSQEEKLDEQLDYLHDNIGYLVRY